MEKRYNHQEFEKKAQELWHINKTYAFDTTSTQPLFTIDTPPPTVSGNLHIGHIFSYTHTDIIARFKRMQGYNVFYPMGYDDNGLPTERYVEKLHKIKAHYMKRSEFIALCTQETTQIAKLYENLWRRIGFSIDWTQSYTTISEHVCKISQYSFIDLYKKNLVYRKLEPSIFCTTCRTSVAQAELCSKEIATTFNNITFVTQDGEKLTVATTRPELLPACVALFYHPSDKRYIHLQDKHVTTPVFNKSVPLLPDEKVEKDKGTGLVMCCTFGDQNDIYWFKTHHLPSIQIIGFDGKWKQESGELKGLSVHQARKKMLSLIEQKGMLVEQKNIKHTVNIHERCKQEIEYLILPQWFVRILNHKQMFLDRAEQINWYPSFMKSRYRDWVENLSWDWCISRQRFYGIPFPVWHCKKNGHIITADPKDLPIDPQEQAYPNGACPICKGTDLEPETDVMDTWNTSCLTPQIHIKWPEEKRLNLPMSMRPQAHDIIRTWAFYTIVKTAYHNDTIPWKDIVISGHVLADKKKLSKSQASNAAKPETLLQEYSADAIRYWTAQGKPGTDFTFSSAQLKIANRLIIKLWNAFKFCKEHLKSYKRSDNIQLEELTSVNSWLVHHLAITIQNYIKHFNAYEYPQALVCCQHFFWHFFCDNYLEIIKDQLFNPSNYDTKTIEQTYFTLHHVSFRILQLFAPIVPHITETLYQLLFKKQSEHTSLHTTLLEASNYAFLDKRSVSSIDIIVSVLGVIRKLKSEKQLSLSTPLLCAVIYSKEPDVLIAIKQHEMILSGSIKAEKIETKNTEFTASCLEKSGTTWIAHIKI